MESEAECNMNKMDNPQSQLSMENDINTKTLDNDPDCNLNMNISPGPGGDRSQAKFEQVEDNTSRPNNTFEVSTDIKLTIDEKAHKFSVDKAKSGTREMTDSDEITKLDDGHANIIKMNDKVGVQDAENETTGTKHENKIESIQEKGSNALTSYRYTTDESNNEESDTDSDISLESTPVRIEHGDSCDEDNNKVKELSYVKTRGELLPEDLPPIEDLKITIAEDEKLLLLGKISATVGTLVVIQSCPNTPALNEDTVLFDVDRNVFGKVFEIFGPVSSPYYSVRFNSLEDIKNKEIQVGDEVYCAPEVKEITQYIFLDQLKQMKGSDASWKDNNEPPEKYLDYSDDETEKRSKSKRKGGNKEDKPTRNDDDNTKQNRNKPGNRRKSHTMPQDFDKPIESQIPSSEMFNSWNCWPRRNFRPQNIRSQIRSRGPNQYIAPASFTPPPQPSSSFIPPPHVNNTTSQWRPSYGGNFNYGHFPPHPNPHHMNMNNSSYFGATCPPNTMYYNNHFATNSSPSRPVIMDSRFIQNNQTENQN